jgi:glutathione-independent formaldehyde dehydrogenase
MKAVVWKGKGKVAVAEVEDARIEQPTDVLIRISSTGICGSDLHMYEGRTVAESGLVMGHENMGVVEAVGEGVRQLREGDRVVLPFNIACGSCLNCNRGFTSACLLLNPESAGAGYGYVGLGPYRGGQAELLRVPYGDVNCVKLPGTQGDDLEDDFLLLSDVFPTGYHATELAGVEPGSTVAIFGAGPVGLAAAHSAMLRGAAEVYVVDHHPDRLHVAHRFGAIPIDFTRGNPVEQIRDLRLRNPLIRGAMRPGEEKMAGVMCGIDAVGYQALDEKKPDKEKPVQVLEWLAEVVNPTGRVGSVGVYLPQDPGGVNAAAKKGAFTLPFASLWEKGIQVGMGQTPVKRYVLMLRDLIIAGRAKPSLIVSHRLALKDAAHAYEKFDQRAPGFTKIILKPRAQEAVGALA